MIYAVIMAGGSGTRFWPQSTQEHPKQFLNLFGEGTMIQNTAKRIDKIIPQERVLVVTNDKYVNIVKKQLPAMPGKNIIGEPVAKNTAPCIAIAAKMLYKKDPDATMVVLPADHHIENVREFISVLEAAKEKAEAERCLVTIGINPNRPETGYGYIRGDKNTKEQFNQKEVYPVRAFTEKPDRKTAQKFLDSGDYYWNSGMFIWSVKAILSQFERHLPEMYEQVKKTEEKLFGKGHESAINEFYNACKSVSIDYGIMEKAENTFVVPGGFGWNDVGSWAAVYELGEKNEQGNVINAKYTKVSEARKNYIYSNSGKMISVVGLEGVAVVETGGAILVCKLDKSQNVKDIVEQLKTEKEYRQFL